MSDDSPSTWMAMLMGAAGLVGGALGWMFKPVERNLGTVQGNIDGIWNVLRDDHVHRSEFREMSEKTERMTSATATLEARLQDVLRRLDTLERDGHSK